MGFLDWLFEPSTEYASDFFRWNDGAIYKGEYYKDGRKLYAHGKGYMIFLNGGEYKGEFRHSKYHGYGVRKYKNGELYEGYWLDGKKNGEGVRYCPNGCEYSGQYIDGYLPFGKVIYPSGDYYIGEFNEMFQRHGNGTYYSHRSNEEYRGRWNCGEFCY